MTAETRSAVELHLSRDNLASRIGPIELGGSAILLFGAGLRCECRSDFDCGELNKNGARISAPTSKISGSGGRKFNHYQCVLLSLLCGLEIVLTSRYFALEQESANMYKTSEDQPTSRFSRGRVTVLQFTNVR